jgi:hypothetical protein
VGWGTTSVLATNGVLQARIHEALRGTP